MRRASAAGSRACIYLSVALVVLWAAALLAASVDRQQASETPSVDRQSLIVSIESQQWVGM